MKATLRPCTLSGAIDAPPSKSMAHRYLIGAALSKDCCTLYGLDYSEDILATMDCLRALGATVTLEGDRAFIDPSRFLMVEHPVLPCRESGSTLRFFLPLALCMGKEVAFEGSRRLMERPLDVYETLCRENGFVFRKEGNSVTVCGALKSGEYALRGNVSSQFVTGMLFALAYLEKPATVRILPPFESRSYVDMTIAALRDFGAEIDFSDPYRIELKSARLHALHAKIEGDYSNAAFLEAFRELGSDVSVGNLSPDSVQGDRVYREYFRRIAQGTPTLDLSDCPDLGPILFALAAMKQGAVFTGTDRLKAKESDRGAAMHEELQKLGGGLVFGEHTITVPKQELKPCNTILNGHNDHRIVMALSVVLSRIGGTIDGAEAVKKSYPHFFEDIKRLGAKVELK